MADNNIIFEDILEVKGWDFTNAGRASLMVKNYLKEIGVSDTIIKRVAIVCYEAEMNVVLYADEGVVDFKVTPDKIILVIEDKGPGIPNLKLALKEGFSTATDEIRDMGFGAGMGLPNIKKNSDIFNIESEAGKGTKLSIQINS